MRIDYICFNLDDDYEVRSGFTIIVDGRIVFEVMDGESEDNSLARNFNDIYSLPALIDQIYGRGESDEANDREERLPTFDHEVKTWDEYDELIEKLKTV